MFGSRRRRATANPALNRANASPNAATAAASAFLKDRASNASLSAAAAATALRARPTTPTSVADLQTKRTLRRTNSTSSAGSSNAGRGPPGSQLQRTASSGSMTERTFRSPSPSHSKGVPSASDAPPVPAIPADMQQSPLPLKSTRRASSVEAQRVASPPPRMTHGRGSSLGPGPQILPPRSLRGPSLSNMQELTGVERPASRGSVNFSLPTYLRRTSLDGQRQLTSFSEQSIQPARYTTPANRNMVYDPNTRSFLPEIDVLNITQRVQDVANKPVKKVKRIAPNQATGTHLSDGSVGGRIQGTAIYPEGENDSTLQADVGTSAPVPAPAPQAVSESEAQASQATAPANQAQAAPRPRKKKTRLVPQGSGLGVAVVSESDSDQPYGLSSDNDSDVPLRASRINNYGGAKLSKKPSVVREDREREEEEDDTPKQTSQLSTLPKLNTDPGTTRTISPNSLPRSLAGRGLGREKAVVPLAVPEPEPQPSLAAAQPVAQSTPASQDFQPSEAPGAVEVASAVSNGLKNERMHSVSPVRATHFAAAPDNLTVRHQPPPRSVSPRKSALKHSNSPRGPSPVLGLHADDHTKTLSEASNDPALSAEDQNKTRKKSVRVSFDESHVAVIEPSPPPTESSSQSKRPWFSLGRGKKKDPSVLETDDDEVMKPRPALPSFGSVRERKKRETTERQLVKPADPAQVKAAPSLSTPPVSTPEHFLGQSHDYLAGAILAQDAASKNEANISKSREPLPPQVTSVEGTGYHSDSESSTDGIVEKHDTEATPVEGVEHTHGDRRAETYAVLTGESPTLNESEEPRAEPAAMKTEIPATNGHVPKINVVQATPTLESSPKRAMSPMPGSWDNSMWDSGDSQNEDDAPTPKASPRIAAQHPMEETPALAGITEPTPDAHKSVVHETAMANLHSASISAQNAEESDTSSIYSDAAEDLSDLEESDGFLSLNAVVESPIMSSPPAALAFHSPPASPITRLSKDRAAQRPHLDTKASEPAPDEGWEKAQEYWKGLSAEKRRQLEEEAHGSSDGSDTEVEAKPAPKPRQKKRADVVPAAIEVAQHRQSPPRHQRAYQIAPGTKAPADGHSAVVRSSMRSEPAAAASQTHIRKSMRGSDPTPIMRSEPAAPETHIRKSMRGSDAMRGSLRGSTDTVQVKGSLQKKYRPMSLPSTDVKADPAAVKQHVRALSAASAAITSSAAVKSIAPPLLRRESSADSASSFKRTRPSNEGFSLRRSMRGSEPSPVGRQSSPMRSGGFSLRSPPPTATSTRKPFSRTQNSESSNLPPQTSTHMRSSMRSAFGDSGPTLRAQAPSNRGKSPSRILGFGRSSSAKPAKSKPIPQRSSRFADSSDEEDNQLTFRSRFVDSSDDDKGDARPQKSTALPRTMRISPPPVRSTPQRTRIEDGDSSDLPDSDNEKSARLAPKSSPGLGGLKKTRLTNGTTKPTKQGLALSSGSLRRSGSGRGTLASPTLPQAQAHTTTTISGPPLTTQRPSQSRRASSFMSILRRKKADPNPNTKVHKSDAESPARRDTRLERSEAELKAIKGGEQSDGEGRRLGLGPRSMSAGSLGLERPHSPKLQKRNPFSRENSGAWPLPEVNGTTAAVNGNEVAVGEKEEERRMVDGGPEDLSVDGDGAGVPGGVGMKKKKKFGKLRRMFRLDD